MKQYEPEIESVTLTPDQGGRFEVMVNEQLIYSKLETHRHAEPGEVLRLMEGYLRERA